MALKHRSKLNCSLSHDYFDYLKEVAAATGNSQGDVLEVALKLLEEKLKFDNFEDIAREVVALY